MYLLVSLLAVPHENTTSMRGEVWISLVINYAATSTMAHTYVYRIDIIMFGWWTSPKGPCVKGFVTNLMVLGRWEPSLAMVFGCRAFGRWLEWIRPSGWNSVIESWRLRKRPHRCRQSHSLSLWGDTLCQLEILTSKNVISRAGSMEQPRDLNLNLWAKVCFFSPLYY